MEKEENKDSYSHILKYTGLFGGVQGLNILVSIVRNKLVAMILGPEGMGLISLFNSTIRLVSDSTNLGIPMSAVREISEAYEHDDTPRIRHIAKLIRSWAMLTAIVGMLLCVLLSPLLNKWTFSWGDHTLHFVLLSPVIALTAVCGGELAILKGMRQLRHLAAISVYNVLGALIVSVPLYFFYGESAIVPSLVLIALLQLIVTIVYSYRLIPLNLSFSRLLLSEGMGMVRIGIAFVLAGILGSGAEFLIRSYLNSTGSLEAVGLYNAGYMMTMTYAGMVFSAMETDYFPRLSGYKDSPAEMCLTVNNQIEVSLLLVAPLLIFFMVFLPILLPALYSGKFMPVLGMMKITILAMYFRSISLPIEYIPLAKGDSRSYLFLEAIYDVLVVLLVCTGYHLLSLAGTGIALTLASMVNLGVVLWYTYYKYGYQLSRTVKLYALIQLPLGFAAYLVALVTDSWFYWVIGTLLAFVSLGISLQILHSKTHLWQKLTGRIKAKLHKHGKD